MKLIGTSSKQIVDLKCDYYNFDQIIDSNDVIQIFNMLTNQGVVAAQYGIEKERDHTVQNEPIEFYNINELSMFLGKVDFREIDKITFSGAKDGSEIAGGIDPKNSYLYIKSLVKKNEFKGECR